MTLSRKFILTCTLGMFGFLSYNLVRMPALALFAESLGAGPEGIGVIVSLSTLTGVILKLPSGTLSDFFGRRVLLKIGLLAFALPPFVYPFVSNLETLSGLRLCHGLATALFAPTALATVAELYQERRGEALGWYTASTQAGALLGPVLGGWLVMKGGFPVTFLTAGLFGMGSLGLFLWLFPSDTPAEKPHIQVSTVAEKLRTGLSAAIRNTGIIVTSIADGTKMMAKGALMAFLPIYGLSIGLNPGEIGLLFGIQGLVSFVAKPFMGRMSDRVGRPVLIVVGLGTCALSFVSFPHYSGLAMLLALAAVFGCGDAVMTSSSSALVADLSSRHSLGTGMGLQGTITDLGHASGPLLAGILIAHLNYQWAFAVIGGLQVVAGIVFWTRIPLSQSHDIRKASR